MGRRADGGSLVGSGAAGLWLLLAGVMVGLLSGCAANDAPQQISETPEPPSATAKMVGVRLKGLEWGDASPGFPGSHDRFALLLGGDDGVSPAFVASNLALVRETLEGACHVPAASRLELSGAALSASAVREAVADFGARARSPESLLLVYLSGLSVVDEGGAVHYLTASSRQKLDGRWEGTFTRSELTGWLASATGKAASSDSTLRTVLVTDVARPIGSTPSPGVALAAVSGWEMHAFQHARANPAPQSPLATPFTRAFVQSLTSLADDGRAAPLSLVHERTCATLEVLTAGRQVSELVEPEVVTEASPRLVASRRISCSVRVLNALDDSPVVDARVSLDSADPVEGNGPLPIAQLPGGHVLRVSAPGYLTRVEEFDVSVRNAGRPLEVRLLPNMVHVQGWLSPSGKVVVTVEGLPEGSVRAGYHVAETKPEENGTFELRLPMVGEGVELVVRRGGKVLVRKPLPTSPERFLNVSGDVVEGLGLVDLGPVRLPEGHPLELMHEAQLALVSAGGAGDLPVPPGYDHPDMLSAPVWLTEEDTERWKLFHTLADRSDWLPALAQLEALAPNMDDRVYEAWRGWLELKYCAEVVDVERIEARRDALPMESSLLRMALSSRVLAAQLNLANERAAAGDRAALELLQQMPLELLDESGGRYRDELALAVESRSYGVAATLLLRMADDERWNEVLDSVATLGNAKPWGTLAFNEMRREVMAAALEAELDRALTDGLMEHDWRRADRILNWMTLHGEDLSLTGTPVLLALAERIAVERVPAEVRNLYVQAQGAFLAGEIVEADTLYGQLDGRMRGRYAEFVTSQRERLRPQLYVRHLKEGESLELAGRVQEAAAAYARALVFDRRAAVDLMRLGVPTPGVLLVTQNGRTGYSEIGTALAQSLPGAVVLVGPGVYMESLVLGGSRSVLGVGGEVEVVATQGSVLTVPMSAQVAASGLTLRTHERGVPTVSLEEASLVLDSCRVVASRGGPAVAVSGPSARAELRRCEVPSTDGDGFTVVDDARLDLVDCAIGLPGSGDGELRRFMSITTPRHVRVTDSVFGRYQIIGTERLTANSLARIQRSNILRVVSDQAAWPNWAIDGLTHTTSIGEALELAEPGATIRVAAGVYHESIEPTRAVRIVADASTPGDVVVDGGTSEFGLRLDSDVAVFVEGVTFRLHKPDGKQHSETVSVRRGHLELADCRIEAFDSTDSWVPAGVAVGRPVKRPSAAEAAGHPELDVVAAAEESVAAVASVVLRRCRISSDALGITIRGQHDVAVWDSEIVGRVAGVVPAYGGRADLVATTIRGCERGVQLRGTEAQIRLEACVLSGNLDAWAFDGGATKAQLSATGTSVR
jgi:hypothetical protein